MKVKVLVAILIFASHVKISSADINISTIIGSRNLDHSEDVLPSIGISAQKILDSFQLNPEINALIAFDPLYGGSEYDLGAGTRYNHRIKKFTLFVGAGVSIFSTSYGAKESNGIAIYGHGGLLRIINDSFSIGLDLRKSNEINLKSNYNYDKFGYYQYALNFDWFWK